jgi:putative membrane protein
LTRQGGWAIANKAKRYAAHHRYLLVLAVLFAAAEAFGGELGQAYLGTQGDVWDAHKDMALASLGALIAMLITYAINRALQRDFAQEWAESLRVKHTRPLGEDEIARMLNEKQ